MDLTWYVCGWRCQKYQNKQKTSQRKEIPCDVFYRWGLARACYRSSFVACTKCTKLGMVSWMPLVFNPQSGLIHSFSFEMRDSIFSIADLISSVVGILGE